jgi:exopolysaccharide biosynthesis operon protein EpsL
MHCKAISSPSVQRILLLAAGALFCAVAAAGEGDVLNVTASGSLTYDDNIFRVPDNFNLRAFAGSSHKGDVIRNAALGLRLDKPVSRQRFQFDTRLSANRYNRYDFLDHDALDYDARWKWQLGNRLQGDLYRSQAQQLTDFGDFRAPNKNIRTQHTNGLTARYWLHAEWYALASLTRTDSKNDTAPRKPQNNRAETAEAGVLYRTGGNNELQLVVRETDGEYPYAPAAKYRLRVVEARGVWLPTGKSTFRAQIGRAERDHPRAPQRDFSGATGRFSWDWMITGKTGLNLTVRRELSAYQDFFTNYVLIDGVSLTPFWRPTAKTHLQLKLDRSRRDYLGDVNPLLNYHRKDDISTAALYAGYDILQSLRFAATLQHETRSSSDPNYDYRDNLGFVSAQFTW